MSYIYQENTDNSHGYWKESVKSMLGRDPQASVCVCTVLILESIIPIYLDNACRYVTQVTNIHDLWTSLFPQYVVYFGCLADKFKPCAMGEPMAHKS